MFAQVSYMGAQCAHAVLGPSLVVAMLTFPSVLACCQIALSVPGLEVEN